MRILGCTYALLALLACQASASDAPTSAAPADRAITARDAHGAIVATITSARPCRVETGGLAVTVPALPLAVQLAGVAWTGDTGEAGWTLHKGSDLAARVLTTDTTLAIFDPAGAAWLRLDAHGAVHGAGGQPLRAIHAAPGTALQVGDVTVTGTTDSLLATILSSPELPADVRALAACNRLLSNEATP